MNTRYIESLKDVKFLVDHKNHSMKNLKGPMMEYGFICLSSKIEDVDKGLGKKGLAFINSDASQTNLYGQGIQNLFNLGWTAQDRDSELDNYLEATNYVYFAATGKFDNSLEPSYLVLPVKYTDEENEDEDGTGLEFASFTSLIELGRALTKEFAQYSVLVNEPEADGGTAYYLNGHEGTTTHDPTNGVDAALSNITYDPEAVKSAQGSTLLSMHSHKDDFNKDGSFNNFRAKKNGNDRGIGFTYSGYYPQHDEENPENDEVYKKLLQKRKYFEAIFQKVMDENQ